MSQKTFAYPIELDIAITGNFLNKISYDKGSASPYYDLEQEISHLIDPMKILYGNKFIKLCQERNIKCTETEESDPKKKVMISNKMKQDYKKTNDYINEKFFNNVQYYNNVKDCKQLAKNNDLSYYWCKNKKDFYNYKFEIILLIINTIILCLSVFLFHRTR
jgi:hypothetical protein